MAVPSTSDCLAKQLDALSFDQIPNSRVRLQTSTLAGAGRGLVVTEDVGVGEELLRSQPLVTFVDGDEEERVCDWCHCVTDREHYSNEDGSLKDDCDVPTLEFCHGCGKVGYCSNVRALGSEDHH